MENCALRILTGLHAGAVIHLLAGKVWTIGNDVTAGVCLLDETVQAVHAHLTWISEENVWRMQADAGDISVFGYPLEAGAEADLVAGSRFSFGDVSCDLAIVTAPDEAGSVNVIPVDAAREHQARMRFMRKAHRLHYTLALTRSLVRKRYVTPVLWAGVASMAVIAVLLSKPDLSTEYREDAVAEIRRVYPNVEQHLNPVTGFTTYTGYVQDQQQLGALRQMALKANYGAVVMNVLPMDVLALNVAAILAKSYRDPRVSVTGPGEITVDIASTDAIKDLEGWNFSEIQAKVLHELPELKTLTMNLKQPSLDKVDVPLDRLGFSVVSSSADQPFVVSQRGDILFAGAEVQEGHIHDISLCHVQLVSSIEAAIFNMTASKGKNDDCK
jgi:Inner membrane component of T3SS, cytoplasmic domain